MKLVEVVILVGSQCLSPLQQAPGVTDAGKVACAVLIRQDPATSDVEILPQAAATDPDVIAMLVKPRDGKDKGAAGDSPTIVPASAEEVEQPPSDPRKGDVERVLAVEEVPPEPVAEAAVPRPKPQLARKPAKPRQVAVRQRPDACGSYKAVWYTNKSGHKRYRCVKTG